MAHSLFTVPQLYQRAEDISCAAIWPSATAPNGAPSSPLAASQIVSPPSLDANPPDLAAHGRVGAWNLQGGNTYTGGINYGANCINSIPADYGNWVQVGAATLSAPTTGPAYARLTVDTNVGYGQHAYAVKVCHNATTATGCAADGATVGAWNFQTVILRGSQTQTYPLAKIPADYAGRSFELKLYNPGQGSGTITLRVIPPAGGGAVTYPSYVRLTGSPAAIQTSNNGDGLYHGKWVRLTINLPPDYTGGQWQLAWNSATTTPNNLMTVGLTLNGPPVSLIPTA
jgi:hypothetical protein